MTEHTIKPKEAYYDERGKINEFVFRVDIKRAARDQNKPIPVVLGEFFASGVFTREEMGIFALYTSYRCDLVEAAITLIHTLKITEEGAPGENVLVTYFDVSPNNPFMCGFSFVIDTALNWKQGTVMPFAREALQKI